MWKCEWRKVADLAKDVDTPTRQIVMNKNIALFKLGVAGNEKIYSILEKNKKEVCDILLCDELSSELGENAKEWNINGEKVTFSVNKI